MCDYHTKTEEQRQALAEFVRQETDGGREIMRFFLDVLRGRFEDAKLCHRVAAARELAKHGSLEAQEFLKAVARSENGRAPSRAPAEPRPKDELADFIKKETDDGKEIARFLLDVVRNRDKDAGIGHKVSAAKELLKRAFDIVPGHTASDDGDDPIDFDNHPVDNLDKNRKQQRAAVHIFGSVEARQVALNAVRERSADPLAAQLLDDCGHPTADDPRDDPYGMDCYGYKVLYFQFRNTPEIRIANKAVAEYYKRKFKHLINEDGSLNALAETASLDPNTLGYLKRNRHLLADYDDESPEDPNPPVGEGFKPSLDPEGPPAPPPPTTSSADPPTPAPPRRSSRRTKRLLGRRHLAASRSGPGQSLVAIEFGRGPPTAPFP